MVEALVDIECLVLERPIAFTDLDAFSQTHFHLVESYGVTREDDHSQVCMVTSSTSVLRSLLTHLLHFCSRTRRLWRPRSRLVTMTSCATDNEPSLSSWRRRECDTTMLFIKNKRKTYLCSKLYHDDVFVVF